MRDGIMEGDIDERTSRNQVYTQEVISRQRLPATSLFKSLNCPAPPDVAEPPFGSPTLPPEHLASCSSMTPRWENSATRGVKDLSIHVDYLSVCHLSAATYSTLEVQHNGF